MRTVLAALALLFPTVVSSLVGQGEETLAGLKGVSVYAVARPAVHYGQSRTFQEWHESVVRSHGVRVLLMRV
jgi:hypothetical protein